MMYKIIVDGEVVEIIVKEDEEYPVTKYVEDKYKDSQVKIKKLL